MSLTNLGDNLVNEDFKRQKVAGIPRSKFEFYALQTVGGVGDLGQAVFISGFNSITGLDADVENLTWTTGDAEQEIKLPGKISHSNISLERGYDEKFILRNWYNRKGHVLSRSDSYMLDCAILIRNASGEAARLMLLSNAWMGKYKPGDLQSDSLDPWIEGIELCHEGWAYSNDPAFTDKDGNTVDLTGKGDIVNGVPVTAASFYKVYL